MEKLGFLLLLVGAAAHATDDCKGHSCNGSDTGVAIDSPVNVSSTISDSSRAFGLGLGDVDINDCYRSYQVLIFQDSRVNLWCMANDLDARGLHTAAAKTRCSLKAYSKNFGSQEDCVAASTVQQIVAVEAPTRVNEDEEEHKRELETELALIREEFNAKFERANQRPAPKVIERTVIEQKPFLTEEQIESLRIKK